MYSPASSQKQQCFREFFARQQISYVRRPIVSLYFGEVKLVQRKKHIFATYTQLYASKSRANQPSQPSQPPTEKYVRRDSMASIISVLCCVCEQKENHCIISMIYDDTVQHAKSRQHFQRHSSCLCWQSLLYIHKSNHWQFRNATYLQLRRVCLHRNRALTDKTRVLGSFDLWFSQLNGWNARGRRIHFN